MRILALSLRVIPLVVVALPAPALADAAPIALDFSAPQAVRLALAAALIAFVLVAGRRVRLGAALRNGLILAALLVGLVALHTFRFDLLRVGRELVAALAPGMAVDAGEEVVVRRGGDGAFRLAGEVGDVPVTFTFDTGASAVVLSAADAERAGFALERLDFRLPVMTAAGPAHVAPITIAQLSVGGISMDNVRAAVARPGDLDGSLLGMTFLNRLDGYSVRRDRLVLTP